MLARLFIALFIAGLGLSALLIRYASGQPWMDDLMLDSSVPLEYQTALISTAGLTLIALWSGFAILALSVLQFILAARVNATDRATHTRAGHYGQHGERGESTPPAGFGQWLSAWWHELVQMLRVFMWRQPFRNNAWPDELEDAFAHRGRRGVLLVHGFLCNRGFWNPWMKHLSHHRHAFVAVNLEPLFGSIDAYVASVEAGVQKLTLATGMPPLVVCHSMGGLAVRAWLRAGLVKTASKPTNDAVNKAADSVHARIHHIITLGSPHHGTWFGRVSRAANGRQMALHSRWLQELERDELAWGRDSGQSPYKHFTCFYSNCDNIVIPAPTAMLPGANNRFVAGRGHVQLAFDDTVITESLAKM